MSHPSEECTFEQAIQRLWDWQHGGTSFSSMLFSLIHKADSENHRRLYQAFPVHFTTWQLWNNYESQDKFFDEFFKPKCPLCSKILSHSKDEILHGCLDCAHK